MKKLLILLVFATLALPTFAQGELDTLYYDKEWKGVESKEFASFYRVVLSSQDENFRKCFKDYYITGELQGEGGYLTIDKYADINTLFDGPCTNYYINGQKAEEKYYVNGKGNGEYTMYFPDGIISIHTFYKDNKIDGLYTQFSDNGLMNVQIEYKDGEPLHDYCIFSSIDGNSSKVRMADNQPIYESPMFDELQTEYRDGVEWSYYVKNGIVVKMVCNKLRDYGKYYQIPIIISNNSMFPFDFEPEKVVATLTDKEGEKREMKVYTVDEYMKKVRRKQNWVAALAGISAGLNAATAGWQKSTTTSFDSGYSPKMGIYSSTTISTTRSYDASAAYQAQVLADNQMRALSNDIQMERQTREEGYLKKNTIYPGETISGYMNIERKKGTSLDVKVDICGAIYEFVWNIEK